MRIFFGTLIILISQLLHDFSMYFYDLFWALWENRYKTIKRIIGVIIIVIIILFDVLVFIALFKWDVHPLVIIFFSVGISIIVALQVYVWLEREKIYKWSRNEWSRASHTYQRRRKLFIKRMAGEIVKNNPQILPNLLKKLGGKK